MLRFVSFGSGSSGNSYLLATEEGSLLIDAGIGIRGLKKHCRDYGVKLTDIHHILITHDHADHVKSVASLSHEIGAPVYATQATHEGIKRNHSVPNKIDAELVRYVEKGVTFTLGGFTICPFEVPHDSNDCVGYSINVQGVTFAIITDVGEVTEEIGRIMESANYLVIEANHDVEMVNHGKYPPYLKARILSPVGHLSNTACGEALVAHATPRLKHVWLCHLSEENNHPELARKTIESALRSAGIIVGVDFALDILGRKTPTAVTLIES